MSLQPGTARSTLQSTELSMIAPPPAVWISPASWQYTQVTPQAEVCLLLGSNIQPEHYLPQAVTLLGEQLDIQDVSSTWETPAVGAEAPNFLNAAVLARTSLDRQDLKTEVLRPLEARLGRVRSDDKFAPRTIDIDLVAWYEQPLDDDLWRHAHAAVPVAELLPSTWSTTRRETLSQVARRLSGQTSIRPRPEVALS